MSTCDEKEIMPLNCEENKYCNMEEAYDNAKQFDIPNSWKEKSTIVKSFFCVGNYCITIGFDETRPCKNYHYLIGDSQKRFLSCEEIYHILQSEGLEHSHFDYLKL